MDNRNEQVMTFEDTPSDIQSKSLLLVFSATNLISDTTITTPPILSIMDFPG